MTFHLLDSFLILIVNLYKAEIEIDILIVRKYIVVHIPLVFNGILCLVKFASLSLSSPFCNFSYTHTYKQILNYQMLLMKFVRIERKNVIQKEIDR